MAAAVCALNGLNGIGYKAPQNGHQGVVLHCDKIAVTVKAQPNGRIAQHPTGAGLKNVQHRRKLHHPVIGTVAQFLVKALLYADVILFQIVDITGNLQSYIPYTLRNFGNGAQLRMQLIRHFNGLLNAGFILGQKIQLALQVRFHQIQALISLLMVGAVQQRVIVAVQRQQQPGTAAAQQGNEHQRGQDGKGKARKRKQLVKANLQ